MKYFIPIVFILSGVAAYLFTGTMNVLYGQSATVTESGKMLAPAVMGLISIFTFACTCVAGNAIRSRYWVRAVIFLMIAGLCTSFTTWNVIGYMGTENLGKVKLAEARHKQKIDKVEIQNKAALESRKEVLGWLQKTYTSKAPLAEKERILDKVTALAEAPVPLQEVEIESVILDARNEAISDLLNVDPKSAAKWSNVVGAALLVMIELSGPSIGIFLYGRGRRLTETDKTPANKRKKVGLDGQHDKGFSYDAALQDLRDFFPKRSHDITVAYLCDRWRSPKPTVHWRLKEMERRGHLSLGKGKDKRTIVVSVTPSLSEVKKQQNKASA